MMYTQFQKDNVKAIWQDSIRYAKNEADKAVLNVADNGTCNMDKTMVRVEKNFSADEMIRIFEECGIPAYKGKKGFLLVGGLHGQGEKNTAWHRTFSSVLEDECFDTQMFYQMD